MHVCDRSNLYVSRTIHLPLPAAAGMAALLRSGNDPVRAIGLPQGGHLVVDLPFRRGAWRPLGRPELAPVRTLGELKTRANRRVCAIEVELSPWSNETTELSLRPAVRHPGAWSDRRIQRWFDHAHAAADTLRRDLLAYADAVIDLTMDTHERDAVAV